MSIRFLTIISLISILTFPLEGMADEFKKYELVPENSRLSFHFDSMAHSVSGTAERFEGFILVPDDLKSDKFYTETVLDVFSLQTGDSNRDAKAHSYSMEADLYPHITFKSVTFEGLPYPIESGKGFTFNLIGILTIKGFSKKVSFPTEVTPKGASFKVTGVHKVKWNDFDIHEPKFFNFLSVYDGFTIRLDFELPYTLFEKENKGFEIVEIDPRKIKEASAEEAVLAEMFTEEYQGKCTLLPEVYNPSEIKRAVKGGWEFSWDEGCRVEIKKRKNELSAVLTNSRRVVGELLRMSTFRCTRSMYGEQSGSWECRDVKASGVKLSSVTTKNNPSQINLLRPKSCEAAEKSLGNEAWNQLSSLGMNIKANSGCEFLERKENRGICIPEGEEAASQSLLVKAELQDGRRVFAECKRNAAYDFQYWGAADKKCVWRNWYCSWTEESWADNSRR